MASRKKAAKQAAKPNFEQPQAPVTSAVKLPEGFKAKRQITMPTLVMKDASPARLLRFDSRMALSKYLDPDPKKQKEKPATVAAVTDMESGEVWQFLVPSVVESNLRRAYDAEVVIEGEGKNAAITKDEGEHTYVGKIFRIQCLGKRPGKRYRDFTLLEVETENA